MYLKQLIQNCTKYTSITQFASANNINLNALKEYIYKDRDLYKLRLDLLITITNGLDMDIDTFLKGLEEFNEAQKAS
ncbi:MAG: hypothetical protein RR929_01075 [Erysipelotrichaceae bacterium]